MRVGEWDRCCPFPSRSSIRGKAGSAERWRSCGALSRNTTRWQCEFALQPGRSRSECEARKTRLAARLAEVVELIRLYGDLASAPDVTSLLDEDILDRRLGQIEAAQALDQDEMFAQS